MVTRWLLAAAVLLGMGLNSASSAQSEFSPAPFFGTWIWNGERAKIDPTLVNYRCYVEVLQDLGGGKVRMRDHRIRKDGQVIQNDVTLEFNRILTRKDGSRSQWLITGPLTYRMGPPDQDSRTAFIVTREIIEGGKVMKHVGEGVLNGVPGIRNEQYFERTTGPARSGDCVVE